MKAPKLIAIEEYGEGYIKVSKEWKEYSPLLKADILKDWIYALESQYKSALLEINAESLIRQAMLKGKK